MKIEAGKRYVRRDGKITKAITNEDDDNYPYFDPAYGNTYNSEGAYWREGPSSKIDLVAEYVDMDPAQLHSTINNPEFKEPTLTEPSKAKSDKVGTGLVMIPFYSILRIGAIFIEGLRYGRDNWKKGVNDKEFQEERLEHALLHLIKYKEGDTTEDHLAKVAWFCVTQMELLRLEKEQNE